MSVRARPIIVQHMRQNVLRVLQALRHLLIVRVECLTERHDGSLALLVDISYEPVVRVEQDLGVILEVDLDDLVGKSEHDGVPSAHPLLDIYRASLGFHRILGIVSHVHLGMLVASALLGRRRLQIALEMLQQSNFLLELFREFRELVLGEHILLLVRADSLALIVVEALAFVLGHNFRRIVEKDTC